MPLPSLPVTLVIAFGLRLLWALLIPVDPVSDAAAYHAFATNIAEHGVYGWEPNRPTAFWAVGTSAIYAAVYMAFGTGSSFGVVAVNLLSALVAIWAVHDLGRRWFGTAEGRLAALLLAIWPLAIQYTTVLASEMHFIALVLLALVAWERVRWSLPGLLMLALAGLFFAGATYVRPVALLVPAALAVAALLREPRSALAPALKAAVATVVIFALVAPWSARNERIFGEPVFMSTNFWVTFWMGNHPDTNGEFSPLPAEVQGMTETERAAHMKQLSLEALEADPVSFVPRTLWKALKLHERETIGVAWNATGITELAGPVGVPALKLVSNAWWYAMLLAALAGIIVLTRRQGWWVTLLSTPVWLWLYFTAVHAIIIVADRYHMPAIPMIALLAACALARLGRGETLPRPQS